jgi:hypothetical protein
VEKYVAQIARKVLDAFNGISIVATGFTIRVSTVFL